MPMRARVGLDILFRRAPSCTASTISRALSLSTAIHAPRSLRTPPSSSIRVHFFHPDEDDSSDLLPLPLCTATSARPQHDVSPGALSGPRGGPPGLWAAGVPWRATPTHRSRLPFGHITTQGVCFHHRRGPSPAGFPRRRKAVASAPLRSRSRRMGTALSG